MAHENYLTVSRQLRKLRDPIIEMVEFGNMEKGELFGRAQYNGHAASSSSFFYQSQPFEKCFHYTYDSENTNSVANNPNPQHPTLGGVVVVKRNRPLESSPFLSSSDAHSHKRTFRLLSG
ncbi:unnamed protein product [Sphenostylis stenocarpa]|uniref:Uncharacterized protein n=1 Tax=Sphenostylis stenocarpa TaxID=92480 RepID=A0AA86VBY3_9FABA|nr:unnamed protein product [Sphenostylis stenocarpa]